MSAVYRLADTLRKHARRRRLKPEQAAWLEGEDIAHRFLRERGYTVVARNYRPRGGGFEIDLVALEKETVVFVEVKTRRSEDFAAPERALDDAKLEQVLRGAGHFLIHAGWTGRPFRLDVVAVVLSQPPQIRHWQGLCSSSRRLP